MASLADLAVLASNDYRFVYKPINVVPVPQGWTPVELIVPIQANASDQAGTFQNKNSGFEGTAYAKNGEVVVSFAGTYLAKPVNLLTGEQGEMSRLDLANDIGLGLGYVTQQLLDAALFYERVKQSLPEDTKITIAGHSLGGGLAALIGVFFDVDAVAFDEAVFRAAATVSNAAQIRSYLAQFGISDPKLDSYGVSVAAAALGGLFAGVPGAIAGSTIWVPETIGRESRVTSIYTDGELLALPRETLGLGIGRSQPALANGWSEIGAFKLHSMTLLTAFELDDDFRTLSLQLKSAGKLIFDESFYAKRPDELKANFLDHLVRETVGFDGHAGNGMLDAFTTDLFKLVPGINTLSAAGIDALTGAAIEHYYYQSSAYPLGYAGSTMFVQISPGVLQFIDPASAADALKASSQLAPYLDKWLDPLTGGVFQDRRFGVWTVALTNSSVTETANDVGQSQMLIGLGGGDNLTGGSKDDWLIGGDGGDTLHGGDGADVLYGGTGDDFLDGGAGRDSLIGGAGQDVYNLTSGERFDVIVDSDGLGDIRIDGTALTGGKLVAPNAWISDDRNWLYTLVGSDLVISRGGSVDSITVQGWAAGSLGINLSNTAATGSTPTNTYNGDFNKKLQANPDYYVFAGGNYVADGAALDAPDMITGSGSGDFIFGGGGNDALSGFAGDDSIDGGTGSDVLMGGQGRDTLLGGTETTSSSAQDWARRRSPIPSPSRRQPESSPCCRVRE